MPRMIINLLSRLTRRQPDDALLSEETTLAEHPIILEANRRLEDAKLANEQLKAQVNSFKDVVATL